MRQGARGTFGRRHHGAGGRAGHRTATFVSGYQGSPLGGYDREIISHKALLDQFDIVHRSGLNEELGATAVMGSQLAAALDIFGHKGFEGASTREIATAAGAGSGSTGRSRK